MPPRHRMQELRDAQWAASRMTTAIVVVNLGSRSPSRSELQAITDACGAETWQHLLVPDLSRAQKEELFSRISETVTRYVAEVKKSPPLT